jgi:hypothetical protein
MFKNKIIQIFAVFTAIFFLFSTCGKNQATKDKELMAAIKECSADGVEKALKEGANPNYSEIETSEIDNEKIHSRY